MTVNRLADYLDHMRQAIADAQSFTEGMAQADFEQDRRTQQAVVMSLIVLGEAATKVMDQHSAFASEHSHIPWRSMRGMRNRFSEQHNMPLATPDAVKVSAQVAGCAGTGYFKKRFSYLTKIHF